jgi:hypothetical protein
LGGIAERLEQPRIDQRRNIVGLAVQHPPGLLRREAEGQLAALLRGLLRLKGDRPKPNSRTQKKDHEN